MNPENFHLLEKKVLKVLRSKNLVDLEQIVNESDLTIDQIRRSIEWLKEKKLVDLEIKEEKTISLGEEGKKAKENGKIRQEGKEYLIKDGDVVHFLFNI